MLVNKRFQEFNTTKIIAMIFATLCFSFASLAVAQQQGNDIKLRVDAPDRYTVQKGDTLWAISGKFLENPWRWPEIWGMNKEDIKNPHLIYPGDVIVLLRNPDGSVRLVLNPTAAQLKPAQPVPTRQTVKLTPKVRASDLEVQPIPTIPVGDLEPFLTQSTIATQNVFESSASIVEARERSRILRGTGDVLYAIGIDQSRGNLWNVFRSGKAIRDLNGKILGVEYRNLGLVEVENFGKGEDEASRVRVTSSREEVGIGDRLLPVSGEARVDYAPHAPDHPVEAFIVTSQHDSSELGRSDIVTLDQGAQQGVEVGHVLAVYRHYKPVADPRPNSNSEQFIQGEDATVVYKQGKAIKIPDERIGLLMVFRVFEKASYAILLNMTDPAKVGDYAKNP
ncbi:MAG: LysM peptidoglycan-binding domain-containing protein [Burkholderiales bacterium]|jgi:hypothetical protein|nr:LysM peptidoglycan-binding domain-containing protein [Burkholderiales bacterium]